MYSLSTLWHERQQFLPGILAVAFSALLINLQCGLLLGLFAATSIPIDRARANVWVGSADVRSVDLGRPISDSTVARVARLPEVEAAEPYLLDFAYWVQPSGGKELCIVIGTRLGDDALGPPEELTPELRRRLTEPGAVVVDEAELGRLGCRGVGDIAEVAGFRVRVVGLVRGLKSLAGPYVFCSLETARLLLHFEPDQATYVLACCRSSAAAPAVAARLDGRSSLTAYAAEDFSRASRLYWLTRTKAGIALGCAAALGLLVGAVVTSQTLYAATVGSLREFAVLSALGVPRWRMAALVLGQSFWVGAAGIGLALPAVFGLAWAADALGTRMLLPAWLLVGGSVVTMGMALLSGLAALRSLRLVEPASLLR